MRQFWGWSPFNRDKIQHRQPNPAKARQAIARALGTKGKADPDEPAGRVVKRSDILLRRFRKRTPLK